MIARSLVIVLIVTGIFLVGVPFFLLSSGLELVPFQLGIIRFAGILPVSLGAVILFWCAWTFGSMGKGTPAPFDSPRTLVRAGLYRIVRNPMYLGAESVLLGEAISLGSSTILLYALALWIIFHLFVVYYEEPNLRKKFGESYEQYCKAIPRWIPRMKKVEGIQKD